MAKKIALNSAYGAVGNQGFRYFKVKNAEAITTSGQLAIRWVEKSINEYMNKLLGTNNKDYVIASDTDSIYISFSDLVKKVVGTQKLSTEKIIDYLDKVTSERFQEVIDKSYEELAEYLNAYDQKMIMKREVIADKGIWTAKKRYILNVWDSEGVRYKEPKLKIMGIEAVKSSTPAACREKIIEGIKIILNKDEDGLNKFIRQFRQEFFELPLDKISFPRGVNGLEDWHDSSSIYKTRTPIHVKGSLLYNFFLRSKKLTDKYPLITSGDKIKFVYLRTPNFINSNVISFKVELPKSLDIDKFIDRELQFVKAFIEPFILIADKVNMKIDRGYGENATLEDLFT
jgi:DNA polymerase elongation subunit (family B)